MISIIIFRYDEIMYSQVKVESQDKVSKETVPTNC